MRFLGQIKRWFKSPVMSNYNSEPAEKPLREFVYLDEVSLRSLLSSQTGEVTEGTSEQIADTLGAEVSGTVGANSPLVAKAELTSRFQTSNSSTLQTSRKATVQSWFREFHRIPNLRFVQPVQEVNAVANTDELRAIPDTSIVLEPSQLLRGSLVEFRVKLAADPVFHLGTMVSEIAGMAEDYPDMFAAVNAATSLDEVKLINKILQRLLAGLIPIRAEAVDYAVVEIDSVEFIVHRGAIKGLGLEEKPLEIVGVTEHLAYWKDIRRVLFSEAEFTVLCRVSRDALQSSWTPVKLADLFREVRPDLVEQINAAGRIPFSDIQAGGSANMNERRLADALSSYKTAFLDEVGKSITDEQEVRINDQIVQMLPRYASVSGQRSAFSAVKKLLSEIVGVQVDATKDLELRDQARISSGLPLFPSLSPNRSADSARQTKGQDDKSRLLDVEVVAIYW